MVKPKENDVKPITKKKTNKLPDNIFNRPGIWLYFFHQFPLLLSIGMGASGLNSIAGEPFFVDSYVERNMLISAMYSTMSTFIPFFCAIGSSTSLFRLTNIGIIGYLTCTLLQIIPLCVRGFGPVTAISSSFYMALMALNGIFAAILFTTNGMLTNELKRRQERGCAFSLMLSTYYLGEILGLAITYSLKGVRVKLSNVPEVPVFAFAIICFVIALCGGGCYLHLLKVLRIHKTTLFFSQPDKIPIDVTSTVFFVIAGVSYVVFDFVYQWKQLEAYSMIILAGSVVFLIVGLITWRKSVKRAMRNMILPRKKLHIFRIFVIFTTCLFVYSTHYAEKYLNSTALICNTSQAVWDPVAFSFVNNTSWLCGFVIGAVLALVRYKVVCMITVVTPYVIYAFSIFYFYVDWIELSQFNSHYTEMTIGWMIKLVTGMFLSCYITRIVPYFIYRDSAISTSMILSSLFVGIQIASALARLLFFIDYKEYLQCTNLVRSIVFYFNCSVGILTSFGIVLIPTRMVDADAEFIL